MKAKTNRIKANVAAALLIASAVMPAATKAAVLSAPLSIIGVTQEEVGYRGECASHFGGTTIGTGISSPLGKVSLVANDCINTSESAISFLGKMVFTMSSGDEFFANYGGYFMPTSYPSIFTLTNAFFTITGGTGNFKGATGGGILQGGENIDIGLGVMQATGTISNFKYSKNYSDAKTAYELMTGAVNDPISTIVELNNNLISRPTATLGDFFQYCQGGRPLAENPLPEASSWALLGIGLASLAASRRRKQEPS